MRLKSPIPLALLVAIPLEAANFLKTMPPLDVDSNNRGWLTGEWFCLHLPGLLIQNWFVNRGIDDRYFLILLFLSGYFDTALLLAACFFVVRRFRRLARNHSTDNMVHRRA
jgi:hypothetical protein